MGLSFVVIELTRPFIEDRLYYVSENLDQIKVPWKVLMNDSVIGFNWVDWIERRRSIETVLNRYLDQDMWEFKEYFVRSDTFSELPLTGKSLMTLATDRDSGRTISLDLDSFKLSIANQGSMVLNEMLTPDFWDALYREAVNNGISVLFEEAIVGIVSRELIPSNRPLYKTLKNLISRQRIKL